MASDIVLQTSAHIRASAGLQTRLQDIKLCRPWDFCYPGDSSASEDKGEVQHRNFQEEKPKKAVQVEDDRGSKMILKSDEEEVTGDIEKASKNPID